MTSSDRTVRDILDQVSLVQVVSEYVPLKKSGRTWWGLCPFHSEKTSSFSVNDDKKLFYCFGCQTGGNAMTFLKLAAGLTGAEALRRLADLAGVTLPEQAAPDPAEDAAARERSHLMHAVQVAHDCFKAALQGPEGAEARAYLERRGVDLELAELYGLGFGGVPGQLVSALEARQVPSRHAEETGVILPSQHGSGWFERFRGRLVFPVQNLDGAVIAFSARIIPPEEDGPKFVNSPESRIYRKGDAVFGLVQARQAIRQAHEAIVVEGNFDVVALAAAGIRNVVAPLGTAFTAAQLRLIRRFAERVTLFFDGDEAGRKASRRAVGLLIESGLEGRVACSPPDQDPDSIARGGGAAAVQTVLSRARPMITYLLEALVEIHGRTPHGLRTVVEEAREAFKGERDAFRYGLYREEMARILGVDVRDVKRLLREPDSEAGVGREAITAPPIERRLLEFLLLNWTMISTYMEIDPALDLLTDAEARSILLDLASVAVRDGDPADHLVQTAELGPLREALLRALQRGQESFPDPEAAFTQTVAMLRRDALVREQNEVSVRLGEAEAEGQFDETMALQKRQVELVRGIVQLRRAIAAG